MAIENRLNLRLDTETRNKLDELKRVSGCSYNEVMRRLILCKSLPIIKNERPPWQQDIMRELRYLNNTLYQIKVIAYGTGKIKEADLKTELDICLYTVQELQKYMREGEF